MIVDGLKAQLVSLEMAFWEAAGNGAFYRNAFAEEGLLVLPFAGGILEKPAAIESAEAAPPWDRFSIDDARVVQLGEGIAALVYRAEGIRSGSEPYRALISSVYTWRDDQWQLVLHQQTPVNG
jgi:hypothetical protein